MIVYYIMMVNYHFFRLEDVMRTIALEEHYATEAFMDGPVRGLKAQAEAARDHPRVAAGYDGLIWRLCDLGDGGGGRRCAGVVADLSWRGAARR
jgi:hypothetical protein